MHRCTLRLSVLILVVFGLFPAMAVWDYSIINSFMWDYAPYAGPALYHGGSTWRIVVIEHNGYRYLHEGDGLTWLQVGDSFDTPTDEVFAIDEYYSGAFYALYREGTSMMLYTGSSSYNTGIAWDIDNYHDFCSLYNYPSYFAFEAFGTLNIAYVSGIDVDIISSWPGCDGDVSFVYCPDLYSYIFARFGDYYRAILWGGGSTDYYIGSDSQAEGWVTADGTVYIAYVNADDELHVITDTVDDDPVDEYIATSDYNFNHPQLYADEDGPVVATDLMVYYTNSMGDWYGEQYKGWDNLGEPSSVFRQNGEMFVIASKILSQYSWGIVSFHNEWNSDTPVVDFTGYSTDDGVLLSWGEDGDLTGSSWTLERGGDELVTLSGDADYRYLDRNIPGAGLYRYTLSVTPPDGNPFRVGPVEVLVEGDSLSRPMLAAPYPSPTDDVALLEYVLPEGCTGADLRIYDLAGRLVESVSLGSQWKSGTVVIDCSAYAPGVYTAVLQAAGEVVSRRLIVTR